MALKLYIGNKNYSSWSMRPWVLLKQAGIPFEEVMLRFDSFGADSKFKKSLQGVNPVGKVPVLEDDGFTVWDTLAIAEYLAERFPEKALWPTDAQARARARSVCAELHSGFGALRGHCPMNIEASLPDVGRLIWRDQAGVRADVARLCGMWGELLAAQPERMPDGSAPLLFGAFSIADAFYAPICMRLKTYGLPLPADLAGYVERVAALPGVRAWIEGALAEHDFLDFEEPYRLGR
ncbi:MAG: glutathione S-transferase family protein [Burkholderiaceae bacterium]